MIPLAHEQLPLFLGWKEWTMVALATIIIFGILGPRMWRDLRKATK